LRPWRRGRRWNSRRALSRVVVALALLGLTYALQRWSDLPDRLSPAATSAGREAIRPSRLVVHDGDTVRLKSGTGPSESIRILGIDAPEVAGGGKPDQPLGPEARAYARRLLANASRVEIARANRPDRYGRTLAYLFVDGRNFSALMVENHLAYETISKYGVQGFPSEAAEVSSAALRAGPPPFEDPSAWRSRHTPTRSGR
jgi:endonuclease YncB( thermonuclease family)